VAGLIFLWNGASFLWAGPLRDRTAFVESDIRIMSVANPVRVFRKDPAAVLDFTEDLTEYLNGDTLNLSSPPTWTLDAGIANAGQVFTSQTATIFISGGTDGVGYDVRLSFVTTGGRSDVRTFRVNVRLA
jgi:hypothetical protein